MTSSSDLLALLQGERQTRKFTDEPVSDSDLDALLETMRWTGSAGNSQPWRFIVVRDSTTRKTLSESVDSMNWIADAPLVLVVLVESGRTSARMHDLGRVDERILLAANALGLSAGIVSFWNDEAKEHGRAILQIPEGWTLFTAVGIGHPIQPRSAPTKSGKRKPLSEIVSWDVFGGQE